MRPWLPPCTVAEFGEQGGHSMKSAIVKRSIIVSGHKTSITLEDAFWKGLKEIALSRKLTLSEMVANIDAGRSHGNLSSAVRLFVLDHYRALIGVAADEECQENTRLDPVQIRSIGAR
jgi:predicted DNA-binding ribbon-helix-helix protein